MTGFIARGILLEASLRTRIAPSFLLSKTRLRPVCQCRFAIMYALRRRTDFSFPRIARFMGLMDHSTIIYGMAQAEILLATSTAFKSLVDHLLAAPELLDGSIEYHLAKADFPLLHGDGRTRLAGLDSAVLPNPRPAKKRKPRARKAKPAPAIAFSTAILFRPEEAPTIAYERVQFHDGLEMLIDEDGYTPSENKLRRNMVVGSYRFARKLIAHRAGRVA